MAEGQKLPQSKFKTYQSQLLLENVKDVFLDSTTADVDFVFNSVDGSVARVSAHKILLAASSNVFKRMFFGELKENGDVQMVDVSDAAFKEFLQYFYLSEVKLTEDNIASVIYLGHKYNVKKCVADCIEFLMDTLSSENVCAAMQIGILYNHHELTKICDELIIVSTEAVFKSAGFLECDKEMLGRILKMNLLSCSEVDVFEACMAWVKFKCGERCLTEAMIKKHLVDLYYDIRFASITVEQLCSLSSKYESVLSSDFETITNIIVNPKFNTGKFKFGTRHAKWNEAAIVKYDRALDEEQSAYFLPIEHKTIFSTNKPLLLGSFMCGKVCRFSSADERADLSVDVEIFETSDPRNENSKCLSKSKAQLQSKETEVLLPHPVLIRPGFFYKVSIGKFPDCHGYYSKSMKVEMWPKSDIKIEIHKSTTSSSSGKNIGFISTLNFNRI